MRKLIGVLCLVGFFVIAIGFMADHSNHPVSAAVPDLTQPGSCAATDFAISKLKAHTEYEYAKLTGIIRNNCDHAVGVQLKWTAFNSDGSVAFSNDFWPASTTNIPPHSDYPFEMMDTAPRGKWRFTVQPISINVW